MGKQYHAGNLYLPKHFLAPILGWVEQGNHINFLKKLPTFLEIRRFCNRSESVGFRDEL